MTNQINIDAISADIQAIEAMFEKYQVDPETAYDRGPINIEFPSYIQLENLVDDLEELGCIADKFSNGFYCGSNLFAIMKPNGMKALSFWRQAEADRKHPWRIARRFGLFALLLYLLRRLSLDDALGGLSEAAGCNIGYVQVEHARAAVDVDSIEDQKLAEKILTA